MQVMSDIRTMAGKQISRRTERFGQVCSKERILLQTVSHDLERDDRAFLYKCILPVSSSMTKPQRTQQCHRFKTIVYVYPRQTPRNETRG